MNRSAIPAPTVARLPVYYRYLARLDERGVDVVSSTDLAALIGVNAATLRRDLSRLGSTGTRGTGYEVSTLVRQVEMALALDREWRVGIVGVGNLGRALARSRGFGSDGFRVVALFDVNPKVVGTTLDGLRIVGLDDLRETVERERVRIGVISTPASAAQDVASRLCEAGVSSVLNFAPSVLSVPDHVVLRNVDLGAELQVLAFYDARFAPTIGQADTQPTR